MNGRDHLQRLTDRSAIRDLALRYCAAVDRRDWDLLSRLFLPDATVGVPQSDPMKGTGEIVARYRRGLSKYEATHHMVTNHEITVEGDSARHICLVHAQHVRPDASTNTTSARPNSVGTTSTRTTSTNTTSTSPNSAGTTSTRTTSAGSTSTSPTSTGPASAGSTFTIGGRYEDQLVRTPHGWKFKHRELVTVWTAGSSAP